MEKDGNKKEDEYGYGGVSLLKIEDKIVWSEFKELMNSYICSGKNVIV